MRSFTRRALQGLEISVSIHRSLQSPSGHHHSRVAHANSLGTTDGFQEKAYDKCNVRHGRWVSCSYPFFLLALQWSWLKVDLCPWQDLHPHYLSTVQDGFDRPERLESRPRHHHPPDKLGSTPWSYQCLSSSLEPSNQ